MGAATHAARLQEQEAANQKKLYTSQRPPCWIAPAVAVMVLDASIMPSVRNTVLVHHKVSAFKGVASYLCIRLALRVAISLKRDSAACRALASCSFVTVAGNFPAKTPGGATTITKSPLRSAVLIFMSARNRVSFVFAMLMPTTDILFWKVGSATRSAAPAGSSDWSSSLT